MNWQKEKRWRRFCGSEFSARVGSWTMNNTLVAIGIHHPKLRKRATAIGEKLGIYRDYPVSKDCMSPFAPIWSDYMVSRQG